MAKEVFEESLDDMLEVDRSLDINEMLESIPAIEPEKVVISDEKDDDGTPSLKNINKVLEKQVAELEKDKKQVDEKVEEKLDDTPANLEKPTEETSDAPFTVIFARDLVGQGLLSSFDEEEFLKNSKELGDAEALRALIKGEIDTNISAAKADLDSGYQDYLNLIGKGVAVETAGNLVELKTKFDSIKTDELTKEENTALRKQVMVDYLKLTTSMTDAKIEKIVQGSIDLGDDIEESKENLNSIKSLIKDQITVEEHEAQQRQTLQAEENRRSIETLKESINSLNDIIPGVVINKQTKVQMFEAITKPVQDNKGRTTNAVWAKRSEDPMFFDERLAYLYATGYFDKNKPWTKASQAKTTKEISALETALKSKNNTGSQTGAPTLRTIELDKTTKDNIDSMRGIFGK